MRHGLPRLVLLLVTVAGAVGAFWLVTARGTSRPAPIPATAATFEAASNMTGVASCSAAACHGNVTANTAQRGIWGNECRVWMESDPHERAYFALLDEPARRMAAPLGISEPHKANECLVCHAPDVAPWVDLTDLVLPVAIGCDTCHGPAAKWVALHYEPEWQKKTAAEKAALGMTNTKDLLVRARLCAGCHVGGAGREVNHDLIAAGHPRLNFELTSYLAMLPKHWDEKAKNREHPAYDLEFEARAWAVGQAVSASAALDLLAARVAKGNPWPEFAEFDCGACHHELRYPSWRQTEADPELSKLQLKLGSPRWGKWYFTMPRLLDDTQSPLPPFDSDPIDGITKTLSSYNLAAPDLAVQVEQLRSGLNQWADDLNKADIDVTALSQFLSATADTEEQLALTNWESGVQLYFAIIALYQAKLDAEQTSGKPHSPAEQQVVAEFEALLRDLQHSHEFHPSEYRGKLRGLSDQLTTPSPPTP